MDLNLKIGSDSYCYYYDVYEFLGVWLGIFGVNESNKKGGNERK